MQVLLLGRKVEERAVRSSVDAPIIVTQMDASGYFSADFLNENDEAVAALVGG